jgi:predicted dehydrogenase/threonine dehydrogenase-like Zn-dependent dehydrogenase
MSWKGIFVETKVKNFNVMKQIIQNYRTGEITLQETSRPICRGGGVLVRNLASAVSLGTERSIIDLGKKTLIGKAIARPDLFKQAWNKAKKEGFWKTFQEAMGRLDAPNALGYSCAGVVEEVGEGVDEFSIGDRVACIGAGFASHAEVVTVPKNLCSYIPEGVSEEEAAFGMLGIIALHGVRTADVHLGECVAVIGLGLLGQISVQLLKASGCKVIGSDLDEEKIDLASKMGCDITVPAEELVIRAESFSRGIGVDSVIITAATKTSEPIETAAQICRFGGKVVLVGVCDIQIPRQVFWEKEIEFKVSKAGGAGIFDPIYEIEGIDYPIGLVRWTERRNLETILDLMKEKKLKIGPLITHRFRIEEAVIAYDMMMKGQKNFVGVLLRYPERNEKTEVLDERIVNIREPQAQNLKFKTSETVGVGLVGAGLFTRALLLPVLSKVPGVSLRGIATATGVTANHMAKKYGFNYGTTDYQRLIEDPGVGAVFVLTRHNLHAKMVIEALKAGKHVFVEKPLCLTIGELKEIKSVYSSLITQNSSLILMVGYNRRHAPLSIKAREFFGRRSSPIMINCRINASFVPKDHWVHDPNQGGGRIIGEGCHFVDLVQYWTNSFVRQVYAQRVSADSHNIVNTDNVSITLKLQDGSVGQILYTSGGDKAFSRERYELFCENSVCVIEDFKEALFIKSGGKKKNRRINQDMGYQGELTLFFDTIKHGGPPSVAFENYMNSTLATLKIVESIEKGNPTKVSLSDLL